MRRSRRTFPAITLCASLLAGGAVMLDAAPASAAPAVPTAPVAAPQAPVVRSGGLELQLPGAPVIPDQPVQLRLSPASVVNASAYEAVVSFDPAAAELVGVSSPAGAKVLTVSQNGTVAIAAMPCDDASCPAVAPTVTIEVMPRLAGTLHIALDATMVIDADGTTVARGDGRSGALAVGRSSTARSAPGADWDIDRAPVAVEADAVDVIGDGTITAIDFTEVQIGWLEGHIGADPCDLDETTAGADVNGDGCIDISDLENLRRSMGATVAASVPPAGGIGRGLGADATAPAPAPPARSGAEAEPHGIRGTSSALDLSSLLADRSGARRLTGALTGGRTLDIVAPIDVTLRPPFVVTNTTDSNDATHGDGACRTAAGGCSLRAAIQEANALPGPDRIHFDIPGGGRKTIQLGSRLPTINDVTGGVTIDGFTQPGSTVNTDPLVSNANLNIEVRGQGFGAGTANFTIASARNTLRGMAIYDAFYPIEIINDQAVDNRILGNHIGTNGFGNFQQGATFSLQAGVWIYNGPDRTQIGTAALADRNVISGNRTVGVKVEQVHSVGNVIQNNIVGLNPSGTNALPNNAAFDIQWYSVGTVIGGTAPGEGNLISGNKYGGVDLSHSTRDNLVIRNRIGTWADGRTANSVSGNGLGLMFKDNAYRNTVRENVISGNDTHGVWNKHNYTDRNFLYDNWIGVAMDGTPLPNGGWGIWQAGESDLISGNLIAHNGSGGIYVTDQSAPDPVNAPERTRENRLSGNVFANNGGLGIDIEPQGPNANDAGDADTGAHDLLNFPEVTTVSAGRVEGTVCPGCTVELSVADSGSDTHGEGRQPVGTTVADGTGAWAIDAPSLQVGVPHTTLAVNPANDTSEFSPRFSVAAPTFTPAALEGAFAYQTVDGKPTAIVPDAGDRNDGGVSNTSNRVRFDVTVPTNGTYTVDATVYAPSGSSNSFWVQMDGAPSNGFYWNLPTGSGLRTDAISEDGGDDPVVFTLAAGTHTLTLSMREDGTGIADVRMVKSSGQANTPPSLAAPATVTTPLASAVDVATGAADADGNVLTVFAGNLPPGLAIHRLTGRVTGTPTRAGTWTTTVTAFDGLAVTPGTITWTVTPGNRAPVFSTSTGTLMAPRTVALTYPVGATDPDGDDIVFSAIGLPAGLSIDPETGVIAGTPTTEGYRSSTILASDGIEAPAELTLYWQITKAPFTCTVDGPTRLVSWTDEGASKYYLRHLKNGTDSFVASTSNTSYPIVDLDGTYLVRYYAGGATIDTTCDGPGNPVFSCSIDGATRILSWTDMGASQYWIRHLKNGADTYIGSTTTTTYQLVDLDGTYLVRYAVNGVQYDTTCEGPGNPVFSCSIDGATRILSWTDMGASQYSIRHLKNGADTYIGSTTTTTYQLVDLDGTYLVRYGVNGVQYDTTCEGPGNPVFSCSIDGATRILSWTDMGASQYSIRHLKNGADTYIGSTTTTTYQLVDLDGTYLVRYGVNGVQYDTTCEGPGNPVFSCSVDGTTNVLSWTDMSTSQYWIRHLVDGTDSYVGSTSSTSFNVTKLTGTYLVRYRVNGQPVDTTCPGTQS